MKYHAFAYHPNGTIFAKPNLCASENCLVGNFDRCVYEICALIVEGDTVEDTVEDDWYAQDGNDTKMPFDNILENEYFRNEDFKPGSYVAIYSQSNATELFYVCKVLGVNRAEEEMVDDNDHCIQAGKLFLKCNYLEKEEAKSTRKYIQYRQIPGTIYVYPEEVFLC